MLSLEKTWGAVMAGMKINVSEATFNAYLRHTELTGMGETGERWICEVGCGSGYIKSVLEQRYYGQLTEELKRVTGKVCEIKFGVTGKSLSTKINERSGTEELPLFETKKGDGAGRKMRLKGDYTFENFAVGGSNQMAYAAAQAVAKNPGGAYNPLFIYGGVGVGKTHLMQAIGHKLLEKEEERILFCSAEEFTNDLVEGIKNKTTEKVRAKYRKVKLLMIDDVQFIAGRATVQEEFFHTFNAIVGEAGQVVMTSDRPPAEIAKLEERLRSRFGAGMIVDVGPADLELRTAILLIKAKQRGWELPAGVARIMAENIAGLRELEGFLIRLETEAEMRKEEISEGLVEKILNVTRPTNGQAKIITPTEVFNLISGFYGVGVQQLKGDKRTRTIAWPRQILMYLLRTELKLPQEEVGRLVGGRDHSTVIHATEKVALVLQKDQVVHNQIDQLKRKLLISG